MMIFEHYKGFIIYILLWVPQFLFVTICLVVGGITFAVIEELRWKYRVWMARKARRS